MTEQYPYPTAPTFSGPPTKRRRWPWIAGGIAVLFVGISIGANGSDDTATPAPTATATVTAPAATTTVTAPAPEPEPVADPEPADDVEPPMSDDEIQALALKLTLQNSDDLATLCVGYATLGLAQTTDLVNSQLDESDYFSKAAVKSAFEDMC